jgi:hypothetical protein
MRKYPKEKFDVKRIRRLYAAGKNVSQIAQEVCHPERHGPATSSLL